MREQLFRIFVRLARILLFGFEGSRKVLSPPPHIANSLDSLISAHFARHSSPTHVNRVGLTLALRQLERRPALILETGSSAWGTNSSLLFDAYVREFGGIFLTVDIREEPASYLRPKLSEHSYAFVGDSIQFLKKFELPAEFSCISLAYLDSYDVNLEDPEPAMHHGLSEFHAVHPFLDTGSVLVVDDTPIEFSLFGDQARNNFRDDEVVPGKGTLILRSPLITQYDVVYHHYNLVLKKK